MWPVKGRLCAVMFLVIGVVLSGNELAAQERAESQPLLSVARESDVRGPALARQVMASRPSALIPLYASFGVMQALDMHSTRHALDRGGREANPILSRTVGSPAAMAALKAGATTGIILLNERLWKRNRVAAIVTMVALNSVYAAVVAHNYSIAR